MPGRRSFKSDESFLEKLAVGAIGARAVFAELEREGHRPIELERGSMGYKIWKNMSGLPTPLYTTEWGQAYVGDSLELLPRLPTDSVDLVITSPPFALQRQKEYDSGRIAGIKYASAKHTGGLNLVAFPDRIPLAAGNSSQVYDTHGNLAQHLGA